MRQVLAWRREGGAGGAISLSARPLIADFQARFGKFFSRQCFTRAISRPPRRTIPAIAPPMFVQTIVCRPDRAERIPRSSHSSRLAPRWSRRALEPIVTLRSANHPVQRQCAVRCNRQLIQSRLSATSSRASCPNFWRARSCRSEMIETSGSRITSSNSLSRRAHRADRADHDHHQAADRPQGSRSYRAFSNVGLRMPSTSSAIPPIKTDLELVILPAIDEISLVVPKAAPVASGFGVKQGRRAITRDRPIRRSVISPSSTAPSDFGVPEHHARRHRINRTRHGAEEFGRRHKRRMHGRHQRLVLPVEAPLSGPWSRMSSTTCASSAVIFGCQRWSTPQFSASSVRALPIVRRQTSGVSGTERRRLGDLSGVRQARREYPTWNCISRSFATIPPSQRSSLIGIFESFSIATSTSRVWYAVDFESGTGDMALVGVARQSGDDATRALFPMRCVETRRTPARNRHRRCPRPCERASRCRRSP